MKKLCLFALIFITSCSQTNKKVSERQSNPCPWKTGNELFNINLNNQIKRSLTQKQVEEDLYCLKLLYQNYYIAQKFNPKINFAKKVDKLIENARPQSNINLLEKIYSLHSDLYDTHIRLRLTGHLKRFESKSIQKVSLKQKVEEDQFHKIKNFVFYRPSSLLDELSEGQKQFIDYIKLNDTNVVIDLRQRGGGDDVFAHALTKAVFTSEEKVPSVTKYQVESPIKDIGLYNLLRLMKYKGIEKNYLALKSRYKDAPITDLLPYVIEEKVETIKGEREQSYKSKIVLLIDSGCVSSCETIVEKLSGHENVKLIGANTGGSLLYSNGMTFELPNSRILVSLPTLASVYESPGVEGEGYRPHLRTQEVDLDSIRF